MDFRGDPRSCDVVCRLAFTKISIATGERIEWTLEDNEENVCHDTLIDLANGYVTGINEIHAIDGKFILTCDVYDPDSEIVYDDPDFDESELDDSGYVEWHSYPGTICADMDDRKLSSVYGFYSNIGELHLKRPFASYDESILNIVSAGAKSYVVTDRGFYCINSCDGQYIVEPW